MPSVKELRDKRNKAFTDARAIHQTATAANRDLTADESRQFDQFMADVAKHDADIQAETVKEQRNQWIRDTEARLAQPTGRQTDPAGGGSGGGGAPDRPRELRWRNANGRERVIQFGQRRSSDEYRAWYGQYLRQGPTGMAGRSMPDDAMLGPDERRDAQADDDTQAGFLVAPVQMAAGLIKALDDALVIRQFATIQTLTSAQSLGAVTLDQDPDDADWTSELGTGTNDTGLKIGKREMTPTPLAKRVKLSRTLIRRSTMGVEALVQDRLAYKFGVTQEKAFLVGNGARQPLGLFTASNDGIPTSRDISTGSATDFTADSLVDARGSLKAGYLRNARWLFHRDAVTKLAKLKDADGQYMWRLSLQSDNPDTLLGRPVIISEYAPNTFTTGKYVGLLGDLSYFWIVEAMALEIQVLDQLYAEKNQIGYIGRMELDAQPVLGEAFTRLKTA